MLQIIIPMSEGFDEAKGEFLVTDSVTLRLEHSLVSASKWESKYERSFLADEKKTSEEVFDYIGMMILPGDYPENVLDHLTEENIKAITVYIDSKQSATWFSEIPGTDKAPKKEIITTEIIYYWMIALNIPVEFERWHLNRLLTLIKVCSIKNAPKEKMDRRQQAMNWRAVNAQRRAATGSSG